MPERRIETLISAQELAKRIKEIGETITRDYEGKSLHMIGVLKGSFLFMADLVRAIDPMKVHLTCDFLTISSYGDATKTTGEVKLVADLTTSISGRNIMVVEDIVDTGLTLHYLIENLRTRQPQEIKLCSLLHKPAGKRVDVPIDYLGFEIPDKFVVGYGLDDRQEMRGLPFIGHVVES